MIDDCIFITSDPLPSFTFKPVDKVYLLCSFSHSPFLIYFFLLSFLFLQENFDNLFTCLRSIIDGKTEIEPFTLEVSHLSFSFSPFILTNNCTLSHSKRMNLMKASSMTKKILCSLSQTFRFNMKNVPRFARKCVLIECLCDV